MITIIYSTHKDITYNNDFKNHLLKSSGLKNIQILEYQNNNQYSLSEVYNRGILESIYDIVVCCHNDIKLENGWGKKLLKDFETNPEFGIIGKAGSCYFPESGVYWEKMLETMVGQVYHEPIGQKKWLSKYCQKMPFIIPVVTVDGLFISFNKNKIKHTFDETIGKFHFYDHPFCLSNYLEGVNIGVTFSFDITHQSIGKPNDEFFQSKEVFLKKYSKFLPIDLKPKDLFIPEYKKIKNKIKTKVAVIIPNKNNFELLNSCIKSFNTYCNPSKFDIFVADTGSENSEISKIESLSLELNNVKLVKFNYYNFGKINNEVVKNHVNDEYEYLMFCNNDIEVKNNVIDIILDFMIENPLSGTVGARLHFKDNTVQHCGIVGWLSDNNQKFNVSHLGLKSYFNYRIDSFECLGNTAALLMIRKNVFIKCDMFNEKYLDCFEDVELNMNCIIKGYKNYILGNAVAYHYESQTRNLNSNKNLNSFLDKSERLDPFVFKNINKLKKYISQI
jgi:GT2 family glycosyltransferase